MAVTTGLERILKDPSLLADAGRLGLLYNQASVDSRYDIAPVMVAQAFPDRLVVLFGPQHGISSTEQDNMKETGHSIHGQLGVPVHSLYSETRRPSPEMLEDADTVLVDIQDVGTRVYTFATTVLYLMEACSKVSKRVIILDRPNPINGRDVEGNLLQPEFSSFVGPFPIPMRHGLTLGELMLLYNEV
ncbi:exo-beta-N-acetylmuramidase NamZ domain-containing protein, partial [Thermodesulfobacteriota bacterium]